MFLDDWGLITASGKNVLFAYSASYPVGTGGDFPGVKRAGREAYHLFPSSAKVKKTWIYNTTPTHDFMVQCLIN
jgi:hypothetical protein